MKEITFGVNKTKVGDVIETKNGKRLLIGDINNLGGVCDDCTAVAYGEKVLLLGNIFDDKDLLISLKKYL